MPHSTKADLPEKTLDETASSVSPGGDHPDPAPRIDSAEVARLVRQCRSGRASEESFHRLFKLFYPVLIHFFVNRGIASQTAEDLAQDALFRVYKNMKGFRFESSFETWLFQIARNTWKNTLRDDLALKRQADEISLDAPPPAAADGGLPAAALETVDPSDSPLEHVLADERTRLLDEALERLPAKMRQCMLLRVGQGLKYNEIAAVLKISLATVKTQLAEARKRLKPLLERYADVFDI